MIVCKQNDPHLQPAFGDCVLTCGQYSTLGLFSLFSKNIYYMKKKQRETKRNLRGADKCDE